MNKIKSMLKEAAARQEIHDVDKNYIISNIDTNKVLNSKPKTVRRPYKRLIPLFASLVLVVGVVLSISLYFGLRSNDKPNNEVIYNDEFLAKLEGFYEETTVSEANNMINVVNTFENVSFDDETINIKELTPEMELSIVNNTHTFINNIENMYNIKNVTSTLINNKAVSDYEKIVEVIADDYKYNLFFNEKLVEEKNVDELNYKYKSEVEGIIVSGDNQYSFNGIKRIKNSYLIYEITIIINDDYYVNVREKFTMNSDLSLKYKQFEFYYDYFYKKENKKKIEIVQKFDSEEKTKEVRFISNKDSLSNEFEMTITKPDIENNLLQCKIDSSDGTLLYINIAEEGYNYKFKYKDKEKTSNEYNK